MHPYRNFATEPLRGGQPFNFIAMRPRKSTINLEFKLPRDEETDHKIEEAGLEMLEYQTRWGLYRVSLQRQDLTKKRDILKELIGAAYQNRAA